MGQLAEQVVNGLQLGFVYALIAVGYTMVYGIIKLINFAHGDVIMVGAFVTFFGLVRGIPWPVAILIGMAVCAILGMVIERLAYRPLRVKGAPRIAALITAIGVSLFIENFASLRIAFGPDYRQFPAMVPRVQWNVLGVTISSVQVLIVCVTLALVLILQLVVYRTKIGKAMRAVALDMDAARLMGINVDRVIAFTFAIGSALAAAAGALLAAAYPQIWPYMGIMPGLKAFTAAVLGGIGSIPGALLGAVLMGQAEVLTAAYITTDFRDAVAFALLILVLLVRPAGLLGKAGPEKV
ncbi:MAG: branched-chain amino acid ABC transporter permease [Symbiobacteriaceae bacterium]|nr:MAG: branched-chain amino acid ABC transporter permease [Bacillota bacterium]